MKKLISIVVPVFNEEDNIDNFYNTVSPLLDGLQELYEFEILFTDNHSTDRTFSMIHALHLRDPRVRCLRYSKNFGYQRSIYMGYLRSRGEAVLQLDVDLQDPPELMLEFLCKWEEGYKFVYGQRLSRQEGWLTLRLRQAFYRLVNLLSEEPLPEDVGEFRLLDRRLIEELRLYPDHQPYLRGLVATLGFSRVAVPYHRRERQFGATKFSFRSLMRMALDGILNSSVMPLRFATFAGLWGFALSLVGMLAVVVGKIIYREAWPAGWATLATLTTFGFGLNFLFLGIMGEYLGRVYRQLKPESVAIIETELGSAAAAFATSSVQPVPTASAPTMSVQ